MFFKLYYSSHIVEQGRPTRGPRKGFEWPAQYFLKLSIPSILAEVEDRFDVKTPFFIFFPNFRDPYDFGTKSGKSETDFRRGPCFFQITMILLEKVGNLILISGEDLFFFLLEITMILGQKVGCLFVWPTNIFDGSKWPSAQKGWTPLL